MKRLAATLRQQQGEAAKLDTATRLRLPAAMQAGQAQRGGQVAANLTCLCVTARRQEELGYG